MGNFPPVPPIPYFVVNRINHTTSPPADRELSSLAKLMNIARQIQAETGANPIQAFTLARRQNPDLYAAVCREEDDALAATGGDEDDECDPTAA